MRVSLLVSDLSQRGAGRWGGAVRPFLLSQALQRAGYAVEIVGFTDGKAPVVDADVSIQALPWNGVFSAAQLLRRIQGEIVIAYKLKPSSYGLALLHRLAKRRPVILDIDDWEMSWHGGDDWRYRPSLRQLIRDAFKPNGALWRPDHPLYLKQIESLTPWADCITTHTSFLQNRFGGVYLPNGKDTNLFDPAKYDPTMCRERYGLNGYRVLMFPGAPRPYKGLEDVLEALEQLNQNDLKLVIVGGSPYDDYDSYLQERWGRHIIQIPKTPYRDMPCLISAAHIVVVPQRDAPAAQAQFPLKLTDAMAMAKPILATRVGDIPSILAGTGYLADPANPAQLGAQLTRIFSDYEAAAMRGQQARQRCIEHYSIETMARIFLSLINSLTQSQS